MYIAIYYKTATITFDIEPMPSFKEEATTVTKSARLELVTFPLSAWL